MFPVKVGESGSDGGELVVRQRRRYKEHPGVRLGLCVRRMRQANEITPVFRDEATSIVCREAQLRFIGQSISAALV